MEFGLKLWSWPKSIMFFQFYFHSFFPSWIGNWILVNSCFFLKLALGFSTFSWCVNNVLDIQWLKYCIPLCCSENSCISASFIGRFVLMIEWQCTEFCQATIFNLFIACNNLEPFVFKNFIFERFVPCFSSCMEST